MYKGKYIAQSAKKKPKWGTILFYSFYGLFVIASVVGILYLMNPLHDWLVKYQASQPETKSQEIFQQYFADPDWEELYTKAQVADTTFEDKSVYAAYMEEKIGTDELICMETSAGLSGDRKYVIRHAEEKIASYILKNTGEGDDYITNWELGEIEVFFQRERSVVVEKNADETVYINGIPLNEDYTVKRVFTKAEDYLPENVHGYQRETLTVTGLLMPPVVTVKNANGEAVPTKTNDAGVITTDVVPMVISETEKEIAISAAKANAMFAIRAIGQSELKKHFDPNAQIYEDICQTPVFMQKYTDHRFDDSATVVSDYYRYSDTLFSARVSLELKVTRTNGTVKTYEASTTYFFTKQADGSYKATNITNIPIQEKQAQVRITFISDGETLSSQFVDVAAKSLTLPEVTAPDGQRLRGWAKNDVDEDGRNVMVIVFTPSENGTVTLSGEGELEPMTLYPVFEKEST